MSKIVTTDLSTLNASNPTVKILLPADAKAAFSINSFSAEVDNLTGDAEVFVTSSSYSIFKFKLSELKPGLNTVENGGLALLSPEAYQQYLPKTELDVYSTFTNLNLTGTLIFRAGYDVVGVEAISLPVNSDLLTNSSTILANVNGVLSQTTLNSLPNSGGGIESILSDSPEIEIDNHNPKQPVLTFIGTGRINNEIGDFTVVGAGNARVETDKDEQTNNTTLTIIVDPNPSSGVQSVKQGNGGIYIDNVDPKNPIINVSQDVTSVNGQTEDVILTASDVDAIAEITSDSIFLTVTPQGDTAKLSLLSVYEVNGAQGYIDIAAGDNVSIDTTSAPYNNSTLTTLKINAASGGSDTPEIASTSDRGNSTTFDATYNNGVNGVGATLTANSPGVYYNDSIAVKLNDEVVFRGRQNKFENGVYICTKEGANDANAIFTRKVGWDNAASLYTGKSIYVANGNLTNYDNSDYNKVLYFTQYTTNPFVVGVSDFNLVYERSTPTDINSTVTLDSTFKTVVYDVDNNPFQTELTNIFQLAPAPAAPKLAFARFSNTGNPFGFGSMVTYTPGGNNGIGDKFVYNNPGQVVIENRNAQVGDRFVVTSWNPQGAAGVFVFTNNGSDNVTSGELVRDADWDQASDLYPGKSIYIYDGDRTSYPASDVGLTRYFFFISNNFVVGSTPFFMRLQNLRTNDQVFASSIDKTFYAQLFDAGKMATYTTLPALTATVLTPSFVATTAILGNYYSTELYQDQVMYVISPLQAGGSGNTRFRYDANNTRRVSVRVIATADANINAPVIPAWICENYTGVFSDAELGGCFSPTANGGSPYFLSAAVQVDYYDNVTVVFQDNFAGNADTVNDYLEIALPAFIAPYNNKTSGYCATAIVSFVDHATGNTIPAAALSECIVQQDFFGQSGVSYAVVSIAARNYTGPTQFGVGDFILTALKLTYTLSAQYNLPVT